MSTENIHTIFDQLVSRSEREVRMGQRAKVLWMTGLSGSGKSTIAAGVERSLFNQGYFVQVLDGDNVRSGLNNNLDFSMDGRRENIRRISELAKLYSNSGYISICSFISPTIDIRAYAKSIIGENDFIEVFVDTPLEICETRDVKGLYKKARSGELKGFTGIDSPYEEPKNADLIIKTKNQSVSESVAGVLDFLLPQINIL